MTALWLAHRTSALWLAALAHRLSGLALAAFLPLHFLTLGLAISGEAKLEGFLRWSDQPIVKLSEAILVFLLAIHMLGGLRLLGPTLAAKGSVGTARAPGFGQPL